jgi:hypothetical protein
LLRTLLFGTEFLGQLPKSQWRRLGPVRQITHPGAAAIAKRCYTNPAVSGPLCATPHGMEGIVAGGGREGKKVLGHWERAEGRGQRAEGRGRGTGDGNVEC